MNKRAIHTAVTCLAMAVFAAFLGACGSGGGTNLYSYTVTLANVSSNQPLAPAALVIHDGTYTPWAVGDAASEGLQRLAEAGDISVFLQEAAADPAVIMTTAGTGIILPGASAQFELSYVPGGTELALATMLVNTNDAFAGMGDLDLSTVALGETVSALVPTWDAGTEPNTETVATVPGPAGGGEGYNADRTGDRDFVAVHPGVLTADEGLAASALDESHRFAGPVLLVKIRRDR